MKILVVGLDGMDPELLDRYINTGKLPYLAYLKKYGVFAAMDSTIPTITPTAWTTLLTGKNPGKHAIGGFAKYRPYSYELKILNSYDRKSQTLWHILNSQNISVGILNYPSLYPPEKINNFMVCGMLTPNTHCDFTYPPYLREEILEKIPGYEIDVRIVKAAEDRSKLLKDIYRLTDIRFDTADYLMREYPCDVFIFVLTETDRLFHYYINEENIVMEYLQYLDKRLSVFLNNIDEETIIFMVSDHGMCQARKKFYVNNWLIQNGLLSVNIKSFGSIKHNYTRNFIQCLSRFFLKFKINIEKIKDFFPEKLVNFMTYLYCYYGGIDWKKTKAYFSLGAGLGIIINRQKYWPKGIVREEEYEGLRSKLIQSLAALKDPQSGQPVLAKVYRREELFSGSYLYQMPDLVLRFNDGYVPVEASGKDSIIEDLDAQEFLIGEHCLAGMFLAYNKKYIKALNLNSGINILDIAPTILHILDIPVPLDFDGRVLEEIFL